MARALTTPLARDGAGAADSAFRRRWTWRTRLWVVVAGFVISVVLRLVHRTLRVRLVDPAGVVARRAAGEPVLAAFWHEGLVLLPLMVTRLRWPGRPSVMLSWHRDAETRGRLGGLRGLLEARRRGEDIVIAPDGPRGPRRRAKEGVVQLARATGLPVVAVGLAAEPVRRLGSWDRLQLPRPFARAVVVLGAPVALPADKDAALAALEEALARVDAEAT